VVPVFNRHGEQVPVENRHHKPAETQGVQAGYEGGVPRLLS
jgi:hypothetical protein